MRIRLGVLVSALISLFFAPISQALPAPINSVPAPFVNFYKSPKGVNLQKSPITREVHEEKLSQFVINFNTIPDEYKPAIQAAVDVWSASFKSSVPITINALWERQVNTAVLAAASPGKFFNGFTGAPDQDLWYASAMANSLAGKDLDPTNPEMIIRINSTNGPNLYLGTDGNCPRNKYDLESIVLHEMAHGLGFLSNSDYDSFFGFGSIQQPTPYDAYAQLPDGRRLMDVPSPSLELGQAMTNSLVWSGANGIKANNGIKPKLYTPNPYQNGSSVSHLDEGTFAASSSDSVMTPNLSNGEIFHSPGPIAIAMLQDMMLKPPPGIPWGIPAVPRNVQALVGDKSALVSFDPPTNARVSQVTSYKIHISPTGEERVVTQSPALITGLKNGSTYSFSINAVNVLGVSDSATTNAVIPQGSWSGKTLDPAADGKYLTSGIYNSQQFILYADSVHGFLKMATLVKGNWQISTIDGNATTGGKTKNNVAGNISYCTGSVGKKQYLDVLYADVTNKDLRLAEYDGKKWSYSVVDGNGEKVNDYKDPNRVRTSSDVSVSSACARNSSGLQVFYRDDSQGILLGAVKSGNDWRYEIVDGDKQDNGRTTGDVGFHLKAVTVSEKIYLFYDSVLSVNNDHKALRGEIREASRTTAYPEDWIYNTVQGVGGAVAVAGFDVSTLVQGKTIYASWLNASGISIPNPSQVAWSSITTNATPTSIGTDYFGTPKAPISMGDKAILFNCAGRLCAINRTDQTISLVSAGNFDNSARSEWITINKVRYALASYQGKLTLFKQP